MRWREVAAWRDRLREADLSGVKTDLSPEGLRAAVDAALDGLDDISLQSVGSLPGAPYKRAVVVTAGTVSTAALEWIACLLGRGSEGIWKHPEGKEGLSHVVVDAAGDLPLAATATRDVIASANVVIAMGSDEAVADIRKAAAPNAVVHEHGHAWSCAWVTGRVLPSDPRVPDGFAGPWDRVAADAALHDGRGCLSPVIVFTSIDLSDAVDQLGEAMARAQERWPIGNIHGEEAQMIRARRAMARVVGVKRGGTGYSVHGLTLEHAVPHGLPRSILVVHAEDAQQAATCAAQWGGSLSTVGTDDPAGAPHWFRAGATRICPTGRMQRPPLDRVHDGVRWVMQTMRAQGIEGFREVGEA